VQCYAIHDSHSSSVLPVPDAPAALLAARPACYSEYAAVIQRFVETRRRYAWGLVCQALAGAMRHVLQDWHLMVAQLEHQLRSGKLTLHALWYYVQPPMSGGCAARAGRSGRCVACGPAT
jgi:gamma-tubulin complex component 2